MSSGQSWIWPSRAGIENSRVFEENKSVDTNTVNARVTGVLGTKRIVLWDTLIARLNEKELLFVMAHEMGHYVLGHVVRSILLSAFVTLLGLYLVDRIGRWLIARLRPPVQVLKPVRCCVRPLAPLAAPSQQSAPGAGRDGVQPLSRARGRPIRARSDADEPLGSNCIRQAAAGKPGQSPSRLGFQALSFIAPEHW